MKKQIQINGNDMRDIIKTVSQTKNNMLSFAEKTWGEKPTLKQVDVDIHQLLQPLLRILEKYMDLVEVQR